MKTLHICYSDNAGGASKAAYRLHKAQRAQGLQSHMLVFRKETDDPFVFPMSALVRRRHQLAARATRHMLRLQDDGNPVHHSLNLFRTGIARDIGRMNPDIVHLHWIGSNMMAIPELAEVRRPVVWTLHDMWAFCGAEHYVDEGCRRYVDGYAAGNRPPDERGIDWNRRAFMRKERFWKGLDIRFVAPSRWMAGCAGRSALFSGRPVSVIPNCLDRAIFRPGNKTQARRALGLPQDKRLLLFGAAGATTDRRKGYDCLVRALSLLEDGVKRRLCLAVFGADGGGAARETGMDVHYLGYLADERSLAQAYNAADIFAAPSLQDNLPNTILEALACGTPCVAFDVGGVPDMITAPERGRMAAAVSAPAFKAALLEALAACDAGGPAPAGGWDLGTEEDIVRMYADIYGQALRGI